MFKHLKRRLVLLYTVTTGAILTLVVMVALFAVLKQENENKLTLFYNNFSVLSSRIQLENMISNMYIVQQEEQNNLLIMMEDNGKPLRFLRKQEIQERKERLFDKLKQLAAEDGVDFKSHPASVKEMRSGVYSIEDDEYDYLGQIFMFSINQGYRSLLVLQRFESWKQFFLRQLKNYVFLNILGIIALYFVSRFFVGRSLKPVEESRKRQNAFVAAASHELRSPLAVIKANISLMKTMPEQMEEGFERLDNECGRMGRLLEDMLLLASKDAGSWRVDMQEVELETLLIEVYEKYQPLGRKEGKKIALDLPEKELPSMQGDKERMLQILSILMDNALRFTKEGGCITLRGRRTSQGKHRIRLEVEDHGRGIRPEDRERIFERFYQEDRARTDKQHFGLGLSIAKELCELQDGRIVCRETEGGGCTFLLYFLDKN